MERCSDFCLLNCLKSAVVEMTRSLGPPEQIDLSKVPTVYHDLASVFSKQKALSLPSHHPYDCSIDLLPDASLPSSRLYNLSGPEKTDYLLKQTNENSPSIQFLYWGSFLRQVKTELTQAKSKQ